MREVLFTKLFLGKSLDQIVRSASEIGIASIDLLIRKGHQVVPEDPAGIARAVRTLEAGGLAVPMATTDTIDPDKPGVAAIMQACADAGIELVRLGYYLYEPERGYAACFEQARRHLDGFESLAERTGIRFSVQLHGDTLHGSGAQTLALLKGHDPKAISAYPDPGNQAVQDGREDWRLTFDVLKPWLACVGMKNGGWFAGAYNDRGQRRWRSDWLGLSEGMVPWDDITAHLVSIGYSGFLSFHSHYETPFDQVIDQTRSDLNYIRARIAAAKERG